jgi:glycosyltransferase involved in cell wall biosynthesis
MTRPSGVEGREWQRRSVFGISTGLRQNVEVGVEEPRGDSLSIALVAPPLLPVPPARYGGTERIIGVLADGLHRRGHDVTLFAAGDSRVESRLVPVVPESLWKDGMPVDVTPFMKRIVEQVAAHDGRFDVIHSHLESHAFEFARQSPVPVVSTLHGRIDIGPTAEMLRSYPDIPLIAISDRQRSYWPDNNWVATIHHGLPFENVEAGRGEGGYLLFVGRLTPEKGLDWAIEVARRTNLPLLIAAKAIDPHEIELYHEVVAPAERAGLVRFLGEVGPPVRDKLFGEALATVMLGGWPEPFGLVAIESLATGTPLIARRVGALPEIVREGIDGFVVDDLDGAVASVGRLGGLDRDLIRRNAIERFSADRMVDDYEALFRRVAAPRTQDPSSRQAPSEAEPTPLGVP